MVLRPGCYLTHDVGVYRDAQEKIQQRNPIAQRMRGSLLPALQLWAYVQSIPEKERAIVALGKRDAAFDAGLPTPALHYRPGNHVPIAAPANWTLTKMMDQHAYLHIGGRRRYLRGRHDRLRYFASLFDLRQMAMPAGAGL